MDCVPTEMNDSFFTSLEEQVDTTKVFITKKPD